MATIKITHITALMPDTRNKILGAYYKDYFFRTFIDNQGNKEYSINGRETAKEEGNQLFKDIMKCGKEIKREDSSEEVTYQEMIDRLMKGYDEYVQYIDDGRQYRQACEANQKILDKVKKIKELMKAEEGC